MFSFSPPFMTDAAGAEAGTDLVSFDLERTSSGLSLGLDPSMAWLSDPERVFPVILDPAIELDPNRDCYMNSASPNHNYCSNARLRVGHISGEGSRRSLLNFPVGSVIDQQSTVLNAELALYTEGAQTHNPTPVSVHRVTSDWNNQATWAQRTGTQSWSSPGGDYNAFAHDTGPSGGAVNQWEYWHPTNLVQQWVDGRADNQGLLLDYGDTGNIVRFSSSDTGTGKLPHMVVNHARFSGKMPYWSELDFKIADRISASVNLASGALIVEENDFRIAGRGLDLDISHSYRSLLPTPGPAGFKWAMRVSDGMQLNEFRDNTVSLVFNHGAHVLFERSGGEYVTPPGLNAKLVKNPDGSFRLDMHSSGERFGFFPTGRFKFHEDRNGNRITIERELNYQGDPGGPAVLSVTDTQGRDVTYSRSGGRYDEITDSTGRSVELDYTASDVLEGRTDTAGGVTHHDYNSSDLLTRLTDPDGDQVRFTYDGRERITAVIQVTDTINDTGPTTSFSYPASHADCSGEQRVTKVTDPRGNDTFHCHDHMGRVRKTIDDAGEVTSKSYDANSNVETYDDATLQQTKFSWDQNDRTLTSAEMPGEGGNDGPKYSFEYNDPDHDFYPSAGVDPQGNRVEYEYSNDEGNLISVTNEVNPSQPYEYGYNGDGTLDFIEDARGNRTTFSYFPNGNLEIEDPPDGLNYTRYAYDALSRIETMTDGRGRTTTYDYDDLDRVETITFENDGQVVYSYEPDGDLASRTDATGLTTFGYDTLDRMRTKTLPDTTLMSFDYDPASNLSLVDDGAGEVTYNYDNLNLIASLTDEDNETTEFNHDENYRRRRTIYPNDVTEVTERFNSGRVKSIKGIRDLGQPTETTLTSFTYDYTDPASGTDTSLRHEVTRGNGETTTYDYDALNRLTEAEHRVSGGALLNDYAYNYDPNSNRTRKTINGNPTSYAFTEANQLCWSASNTSIAGCANPSPSATIYSYDLSGNLTWSSAGFSATYNDPSQTTSMTPPGGSAIAMSYADTAQDERVSAGAKTFAYNLLGMGMEAQSGSETQYVRDNKSELISQRSSSGTEYFLFDALGSVVALTDDNGNVVARYEYDPYGELGSQSGTSDTSWRFAGGYFDDDTELTKFGTRYYSADLGRWTQVDPLKGAIEASITLNPYTYAGSDPVNNRDPTGELFQAVVIGVVVFSLVAPAGGAIYAGLTEDDELAEDTYPYLNYEQQDDYGGPIRQYPPPRFR